MTRRVEVTKGILWFISGLAAAVTIVRFSRGLGTTTALSDTTPWGLWVGFDVMGGVALAAGGFVIGAIAHVFQRDRYHHAVRPAILTALLGYAAVAVGLLYDLGLPWNIWHPLIFWNPRSPLFEVAWCVMTYLGILFLEFLPVFLERTRFKSLYRTLLRLQLPLIILGISVSTLHQSSLGTLLLIMPFRIHPLWYSPHLPELFFVSAICLGLVMVIFESSVTAWLYERRPDTDMLSGLSRFAAAALAFYLAFRFFDLWRRDTLGMAFEGGFEARLFWFEIALSAIVPLVLFLMPRVRRNHTGVFLASSMGVMGFLLYRIDASGLAQVWATRTEYFPMWTEFVVSLGIVSFFALIYLFIQEHFPVEREILDDEDLGHRSDADALEASGRGFAGRKGTGRRRPQGRLPPGNGGLPPYRPRQTARQGELQNLSPPPPSGRRRYALQRVPCGSLSRDPAVRPRSARSAARQ